MWSPDHVTNSPPCSDVTNVEILTENGVGGDAPASGRATVSNSIIPTNSSETTNGEEYVEPFHGFDPEKVISEPFHGLDSPEGRIDPILKMSRIRKKPDRLIEYPNFLCATNDDFSSIVEPHSYEEAITSTDAKEWVCSMEEEMSSLKENETWCLEKLSNGRKTVKNKWIFKVKMDSFGHPKARLVAKGFSKRRVLITTKHSLQLYTKGNKNPKKTRHLSSVKSLPPMYYVGHLRKALILLTCKM